MSSITDIPSPVVFNPFKHHRGYILELLRYTTPEAIVGLLDQLCNNYVDIYTGKLSPGQLAGAVISQLESSGAYHHAEFTRWVSVSGGYRILTLRDGSEWIVRESSDPDRYVHIHPSRTGFFTQRYKGSTLKTVYMLGCTVESFHDPITLDQVNRVRTQAGLSPVKNLERSKGILNCYTKIFRTGEELC
jgi:hypothetical protein